MRAAYFSRHLLGSAPSKLIVLKLLLFLIPVGSIPRIPIG